MLAGMKAKKNTGLFARWFTYKIDCLVMLLVLWVQFYLFYGEWPFIFGSDRWLPSLLESGPPLWISMTIGGAIYWTIVDYHPALEQYRESRVVMQGTDELPQFGTRVVRSLVKSATLFSASILILFGLLRGDRRFLHDYLTGTERVSYKKPTPLSGVGHK